MHRLLLLLLLFTHPLTALCQPLSRAEEEKAYAKAIEQFLIATYKRDSSVFDTLLIGHRPDFPNITLPTKVANTTILFLTPTQADKKRAHNKKLVFINLVGNVSKPHAEFIFVAFYPGYIHQYDCTIRLTYHTHHHTFTSANTTFKNYAYTPNSHRQKKK